VTRLQLSSRRPAAETSLPPTTIRDYVRRLVVEATFAEFERPTATPISSSSDGLRRSNRGWPAVVQAYARVEQHLDRRREHVAALQELQEAVRRALDETDDR
jgi:hypothetical protein